MAIGAHELLLIVRAQNQASAALGRVSRDLRRMAAQRDIEMRRASIANRLARNNIQQMGQLARIESVLAHDGAQRLAHNQALARNALQQMNIQDRIAGLEVRRSGIARANANLEVQKLRLLQQEMRLEQSLEKIELRRRGINAQIGRLGTQFRRNLVQQQQLAVKEFGLGTQLMERQLRLSQANRRVMAARGAETPDPARIADAERMADIARRRVRETQMMQAGIPGQRGVLAGQAGDIARQTKIARDSLIELQHKEADIAESAKIAQARHAALAHQFEQVAGRGRALTAVEKELHAQLQIAANEVGVINARWEQHKVAVQQAAMQVEQMTIEQRQLAAAMAEANAEAALQGARRMQDASRAVSHFGRVLQMTGLVGTAAFGMMAIGAAHFNKEATRVATQTGPIGSGTGLIVKNAERAQTAIIALMKEVPANQDQLTNALYDIYSSMNVTFGQGTQLLKLFAQTWVAGGMLGDVQDVSGALITLGNNWQIAASDMNAWRKLSASTLATVRFGRLTVEQYTQTMNQLAPAFHGAHQSIDEMNGAIAFMTRLLPSQRMSAAGLARLMEIISRFAAHPAAGFEQLAANIQDASGNLLPLNKIIDIMIKAEPRLLTSSNVLNNWIKTISNLQGTVQARRALIGLVQQNDLYDDVLSKTTGDVNEFQRSLKAMERSTGVKWAQFVNTMRALALEVGMAALPAFIKFGAILQKAAKWYEGLDKSTKNAIASAGAYIAIGTLLFGTLLAVVGSLAAMVLSVRVLAGSSGFGGLSKLMGAGGAAGAAKALGGEAGFANLRLIKMGGAIGIILALLGPFHSQLFQAVHPLVDLNAALKITTGLLTVFTVKRIVDGFAATRTGAILATTEVVAFRAALLKLTLIGAITIPIIAKLSTEFDKDPRSKTLNPAEKWWLDALGGFPVIGGPLKSVAKAGGQSGRNFMDSIGLSDKARAEAKSRSEAAAFKQFIDSQTLMHLYEGIKASANVPEYMKMMAQNAFMAGDIKTLRKIDKQRIIAGKSAITGARGVGTAGRVGQASIFQEISDAKLEKQVRHVLELQKAFDKAPSAVSYRAFTKAHAAATKGLTKESKEMFEALLSAFASVEGSVKKISNATALAMQRNIKQLEAIAKRTGLLKDYMAVQKAQAAFDKVATSDQSAAIQALMAAEDEATQKAVENAQKRRDLHKQNMQNAADLIKQTTSSLLEKLQGFRDQAQSMLGDLFSGRYITTSATVLDRQKFGFALRPSDLMKDLNMQVSDLQKFTRTIDKVAARGAPEKMIEQLQAMGPAAQKQIELLLRFTPGQFKQYVGKFNEGQRTVERIAKAQLMAELEKWKLYGKAVQLAIINGMRSEDVATDNAILALVEKMFPGLRKQSGSQLPKPVGPAGKGNAANNNNSNKTVNFYLPDSFKDASLMAQLKASYFFEKNIGW